MSAASTPIESLAGWRYPRARPSLPESHGAVRVPRGVSFWRKALAFAGPGYMVAVGYMDPGNWATDLAGGSRFGYTLLSVILLSNLMAILLQSLALNIPLVQFIGERGKMGRFANGRVLQSVAWSVAAAIVGLNGWLLFGTFREWLA